MISSAIPFLLASLVLNCMSTSFAAPLKFTPRDHADGLVPRPHTPGVVDKKITRRVVQKDVGINEMSNRGDSTIVISSVTTIVQDGKSPDTFNLISTTATVVEKGKGKVPCSGKPSPKKSCGKKANGPKPGKKCGKKSGHSVPSGKHNSTTVSPLRGGNATITQETPSNSNITSAPPIEQAPPILPDDSINGLPSKGNVLVQDSNNNSSSTPMSGDAPGSQPVRRRATDVANPISDPPKPRGQKQRLDKRNRMKFN